MTTVPSRQFAFYTEEQVAAFPRPTWLIEPLLPAASVAMLYGPSGVGKSFIALAWGYSIAHGLPWLGRPVRQGSVIYVAAEGAGGLGPRLKALQRTTPASEGRGALFILEPVQLVDETHMNGVIAGIGEQNLAPLGLIVIDTLAMSFAGDENSAKDTGELIRAANRLRLATGASVLFVHHSGKPPKRGQSRRPQLERGSSALRAGMDTVIVAWPNGSDIELQCEKQKDAEKFDPFSLELVCDAESCTVQESLLFIDDSLKRNERAALEALAEFSEPDGARASEWQEKSGLPQSTFYSLRTRLVDAKYVEQRAKRYFITANGMAAIAPAPKPLAA